MNHCNTKLTPHIREKMISDYQGGKKVTQIAKDLDISRKCFYYWLKRYEGFGREGLLNRSSRPRTSPFRLRKEREEEILKLRRRKKIGPQRIAHLLRLSSSTVYKVLVRAGENRLYPKERREVFPYEKSYPGELVHIDVKHLPQIRKGAKEYQFTAIDDYSREAYATIFERKTTVSAARFLEDALKHFSYPIRAVLTDNGLEFSMDHAYNRRGQTKFSKTCKRLGIKHKLTKPHKPETNGKVERFHRTIDEELYRIINFQGSEERKLALKRYLRVYNEKRIHLGIGGLTPMQRRNQYFLSKKCYQCA